MDLGVGESLEGHEPHGSAMTSWAVLVEPLTCSGPWFSHF